MKQFALKADNDYLMGVLLHLFVDGKWQETHLSGFAEKEGEGWYEKYNEENFKMTSYAFHNRAVLKPSFAEPIYCPS